MTGLGIAGGIFNGVGATKDNFNRLKNFSAETALSMNDKNTSIIGAYGQWAAGLTENKLPSLSFRRKEFTSVDSWRRSARKRLAERLAVPPAGGRPVVTVNFMKSLRLFFITCSFIKLK